MRAFAVLMGVLAVSAAHAEPRVFYTAHFPDRTSVQMSVMGDGIPDEGEYDFVVAIGLARINATGVMTFFDRGRHRARIRCAEPAYVGFGDRQFPVHAMSISDWKQRLWETYCETPVS